MNDSNNLNETSGASVPVAERVPIYRKVTLTVREAAEYSNIGINKIDSMLRSPNCPFVLFVGTKKLVKRREFEEYISRKLAI
jgi:excisionase family DNA binding protein